MNSGMLLRSNCGAYWHQLLVQGVPTAICFAALVGVGACQPKAAKDVASTAPAATTAPPAQVAQVVPPEVASKAPEIAAVPASNVPKAREEDAAGGKARSISGGWVNAGGACDSGAAVMFNSDGTYMAEGEKGTWALSGKILTVTTSSFDDPDAAATQGPEQSTGDVGEKSILTVLSITDDAARVVLANGTNANWTRCTS